MDSINKFIEKFRGQYIDSDTFKMQPGSEFRQIDSWDSLTGMAVLVMIKSEYGVDISVEKFRDLKTVKDVYDYVKSEKGI